MGLGLKIRLHMLETGLPCKLIQNEKVNVLYASARVMYAVSVALLVITSLQKMLENLVRISCSALSL